MTGTNGLSITAVATSTRADGMIVRGFTAKLRRQQIARV